MRPRLGLSSASLLSLNAWCELRSPTQQVGKSQAGTTELLIEPHAEVVQPDGGGHARLQAAQVMGQGNRI
jgi:hypothetical protein